MLHFARIIGLLGTLLISTQVLAVGLGDLSGKEASAGLKEALSRGADMAVSQLGAHLTVLSDEQAAYIGVTPQGPFKAEHYRY